MSKMSHEEFTRVCEQFAALLGYPKQAYSTAVSQLIMSPLPRKPRKSLEAFRDAVANMKLPEQQELYTRTLDLSPLCSPALSVHLFGVESFKRSHLMVGLLDMYRDAEFTAPGESADHVTTVVAFLPYARLDYRQEIIQFILVPALSKMIELLESKQNPLAHLLRATLSMAEAADVTEVEHA